MTEVEVAAAAAREDAFDSKKQSQEGKKDSLISWASLYLGGS